MSKIMPSNMFNGRAAALGTMHAKEKVIAPVLLKELGIVVQVPTDFDTDQFGTFTRDKKRPADQLTTARLKALAAMEACKTTIGIASEGSFGNGITENGISNIELVYFIDTEQGIEVCGYYESPKTNLNNQYVTSVEEALDFAQSIGFPEHGLILRKNQNDIKYMIKGINNVDVLKNETHKLLHNPIVRLFHKKVWLETDMRAHMNPTRMNHIELATHDLVIRLQSLCPECHKRGYGISGTIEGLACEWCGGKTLEQKATLYSCPSCDYKEEKVVEKKYASPANCPHCNP